MTVKEFYVAVGADYDETISRLMNDKMIYKYCRKFAATEDYNSLIKALEERDYTTAFRMAHNLKGMCLYMGFCALYKVSSELCEALRSGQPVGDIESMLSAVTEEYRFVISCIGQIEPVL